MINIVGCAYNSMSSHSSRVDTVQRRETWRRRTWFTHMQTAAMIANRDLYDLTFGNVKRVLEVAMSRALYRWYLRGEISEEWA